MIAIAQRNRTRDMKLAGEVAVVTGAGRGIGRAIALAQAKEGAKVALLARTAAEIEAVAEEVGAEGGVARAFAADIVDLDSVANTFAAIEAAPGTQPARRAFSASRNAPDSLAGSGVLVFAMDPGMVRTAMTEYQLKSEAGRTHLPNIPRLFEAGVDVPPTLAARLSVEIGCGQFDRLAG